MHISDVFAKSIFIAIYRVFEALRERAAVTLFLSVSLERNTLPLTGAWGGWVVGGLGGGWLLDVGCWVWIIGFDVLPCKCLRHLWRKRTFGMPEAPLAEPHFW